MNDLTLQQVELVLVQLFGYRWVSYVGIPSRGTPGYPQKCRVRSLLSPAGQKDPSWRDALARSDGRDADGTEPYSYGYIPACPSDYEVLEQARKAWRRQNKARWQAFVNRLPPIADYQTGHFWRAAIWAIETV